MPVRKSHISHSIGCIDIDVFHTYVPIFLSDNDRLRSLASYGISASPIDGAHMGAVTEDFDSQGGSCLSLILTPAGALKRSTWVHEAVHIADLMMERMGMPSTIENTETRAYIVGFVYDQIDEILAAHRQKQKKARARKKNQGTKASPEFSSSRGAAA